MKKYIKPVCAVINVDTDNLLSGSDVTFGGSNSGRGITSAEGKGMGYDIFDDEDEDY